MQIDFAHANLQQAKRAQHFYNTIEVLKCRELQGRKEPGAPRRLHFTVSKRTVTTVTTILEHGGVPTAIRYWSSWVAVTALDTVLVLDQRNSSPKSRKHCALRMGRSCCAPHGTPLMMLDRLSGRARRSWLAQFFPRASRRFADDQFRLDCYLGRSLGLRWAELLQK